MTTAGAELSARVATGGWERVVRLSFKTLSVLSVLAIAGSVAAQNVNPVYVDDSPVARETLARVIEFEAAGNESEAVRELQRLLDEQPDRIVAAPGQNSLFTSVRSQVHKRLLASPKLLEKYRAAETARAQKELAAGSPETVERSRLLTLPGFEAAMRIAQLRLESAQFEAARFALEELLDHPDRKTAEGAALNRDAARLMAVVARYLDRADVWKLADRWATESGQPAPSHAPIDPPAWLKQPRADFMTAAPGIDSADVPSRPLWTSTIEPPGISRDTPGQGDQGEESAHNLYVLPTVVGDCVYVNDGMFVSARDRFTLQPRWVLKPRAEEVDEEAAANRRAGMSRGMRSEDNCTVSIQGRVLVATTDLASSTARAVGRTHALDISTGKVLWSFLLPDLDPSLEGASVRGPAMIDGGTIVLVAKKGSQGRRMVALYLVGVSLDSGALRWVRPIGSAGALPFRGGDRGMDHAAVLHQGVVYCVDRLGVLAGVEAATGRPLWVRRAPVVSSVLGGGMVEMQMPWQWDCPIVADNALITLSPDRSELFVLDRFAGTVTARRSSAELGSPSYLLRVDERLGAVSGDSVFFTSIAEAATAPVSTTRTFGAPGIRGRVMVSGSRILVPRSDGVAVIDPADPAKDAAVMRLQRTGNILPLQNQLLVIDAASVHSFVTWDVAQKLLGDRMAANPSDPDAPITFAELAYRSQHPDQIAPAVDKAIAALDRNPTSESSRLARTRLFGVLREMVDSSNAGWSSPDPAPAAPKPAAPSRRRPGQPAGTPRPPPSELPALDLPHLSLVIERWGRIAQSVDERAMHLMALGRLRESENQPAVAAEAYQRILADPQLAGASWRRGSVSVRAEIEATRRTRQLVLEHGPAVYAAFEAQAAADLAALGATAPAEELERLARQYPAAGLAATLWSRAADLHERAGRPHTTIAMLREGLFAAESARAAGVNLEPGILGDLGGRLISRLQSLDQLFAAAQLIARLRSQYPDVPLSDHGASINSESLATSLMGRLAELRRLPRLGPQLQPTVQPLVGWVIMQPRSKEQLGRACEHLMLIAPGESKVALWGVSGGEGTDPGVAPLQQLWTREYQGSPPLLYRIDAESVYLFWDHGSDGAVMERIGAVDGRTIWKTDAFRTLFEADVALDQRIQAARNVIETPIDGAVKLTDVAVTFDEQVLAMVERSGRIAVFDPGSGKLLWKAVSPVLQVHDTDVGAGVLAVGGLAPQGARLDGAPSLDSLVVVYDVRTGRQLRRLDQLDGKVRWVRISGGKFPGEAPHASLIAGLDPEITCIDLETGKPSWTIPGETAIESRDAWVFGDRLFLLDDKRSIWLVSIAAGKLAPHPLETYEHLVGNGSIQCTALGRDFSDTAFSTDRGVCLFDAKGRLIGIDALDGGEADEGQLLPPIAAADFFVTIETTAGDGPGNQSLYNLHLLDTHSAMLKNTRQLSLELPPRRMALLDGRILITAGTNTIVYSAPETDR